VFTRTLNPKLERFIRVNPTAVELIRKKPSLGPQNGKWLKRTSFIWYRALTRVNLVFPSLEPSTHTFRVLESCWHAGEGLPYCPVTSRGSSGAANDRAGEEYQVKARNQIRANALLATNAHTCMLPPNLAFARYCQHQYCMVYGIHKEGRWEGVYCTMVVQ